MKKLFLVFSMLLTLVIAKAGEITVNCTVYDNEEIPIPDVSVHVVGTYVYTWTDKYGKFTLTAQEGADILISYDGYESQTIKASRFAELDGKVYLVPKKHLWFADSLLSNSKVIIYRDNQSIVESVNAHKKRRYIEAESGSSIKMIIIPNDDKVITSVKLKYENTSGYSENQTPIQEEKELTGTKDEYHNSWTYEFNMPACITEFQVEFKSYTTVTTDDKNTENKTISIAHIGKTGEGEACTTVTIPETVQDGSVTYTVTKIKNGAVPEGFTDVYLPGATGSMKDQTYNQNQDEWKAISIENGAIPSGATIHVPLALLGTYAKNSALSPNVQSGKVVSGVSLPNNLSTLASDMDMVVPEDFKVFKVVEGPENNSLQMVQIPDEDLKDQNTGEKVVPAGNAVILGKESSGSNDRDGVYFIKPSIGTVYKNNEAVRATAFEGNLLIKINKVTKEQFSSSNIYGLSNNKLRPLSPEVKNLTSRLEEQLKKSGFSEAKAVVVLNEIIKQKNITQMKKTYRILMMAAIVLMTAMVSSCSGLDDLFGEWEKPTPTVINNGIPLEIDNSSTVEIQNIE